MAVQTYSPKKVTISWLPAGIITGYADGSFIKVSRRTDTVSLIVGSDGGAARSMLSDKSGEITISLLQTSPSNDLLSAAAISDELSGAFYGPLFVKDLFGRSLYACANAWVRKIADGDYDREVGPRDWVFETDNLEMFHGGNS